MPMNRPERGGGKWKKEIVSGTAGRIPAVNLGEIIGFFKNLAACRVDE